MRFHRSWSELKTRALREWSTWIGIVLVVAALVATFAFTSAELAEYEARVGHAGPIVLGIVGVLGILKRDKRGGDQPPC